MTDGSQPQRKNEPVKTLLSAEATPEEMQRWLGFTLQNLSKNGKLHKLPEDLALIAAKHIAIKYHPLWFIKNRILSGYICRDYRQNNAVVFNAFDGGRCLYDILCLNQAVSVAQKMLEKKEQTLLIVPIRAQSLYERPGRELFKYFCQTHASLAKRNLVFMLTGLKDKDIMPADLDQIKNAASFCRAFILETSAQTTNIARFAKIRLHACGFDSQAYKGDEKDMFTHFDRYVESCEKLGVKSFLTGVEKPSIMSAAIASGFTYLEGPAVAGPEEQPRHAEFLEIGSVYQNIFPENPLAASETA